MPRETSPAFQFYPQDFLSDTKVSAMTATACGVYIRLLCHCWLDKVITTDPQALARLGGYQGKNWPAVWGQLSPCFRRHEGGYIQPRIERERAKQAEFRELKRKAGLASAQQRANRDATDTSTQSNPPSSSSSSSLSSSSKEGTNNKLVTSVSVSTTSANGSNGHPKPQQVNGRSKHPIFSGQRFVVFDWMLEDMRRILGPEQLDKFDVHEWFFTLDACVAKTDITLQRNDVWPWLQSELVKESIKRGMPLMQVSEQPRLGKQTQRLMIALSQLKTTHD